MYSPKKVRIKAYSAAYELWVEDVGKFYIICECYFKATCGITYDRFY